MTDCNNCGTTEHRCLNYLHIARERCCATCTHPKGHDG